MLISQKENLTVKFIVPEKKIISEFHVFKLRKRPQIPENIFNWILPVGPKPPHPQE